MREEVLKSENDMQEAKTIYLKYVKNGEVSGYLFGHKYYKLRTGCFPRGGYMALELFFVSARINKRHHHHELNRFNKKLDLSTYPRYEFFKTADIELHNEDANKIIDKCNNEKTLIFLDPPYIASCNIFYSEDSWENMNKIYEILAVQGLNDFKSKTIICHENHWLLKIIFRDYLDKETEYIKMSKYRVV